MDEAELVAALKRGEPVAMETVVEIHGERLLRSATLLSGDQSLAEDLVQDVFIEAGHSIHRFREHSSLYTWLHSILLNLVRHHRRDSKRLVYDNELAAQDQTPGPEAAAHPLDLHHAESELTRALRQLSDAHREVLVLRYYERMKIDEIACCLGVSKGTIKSRLHYAIDQMQKLLPPEMNLFGAKGTKETV
jgi:RNA polymerase sigma-70 factor (ECF subfamily)